jgi:hypothetical protein
MDHLPLADGVFGTAARIGILAGFGADGRPQVRVTEYMFVAARSLVPIAPEMKGREVAVLPMVGDPCAVLILGVLQPPTPPPGEDIRILEAERELVLRCGKSSLTLTSDGRVTVRGKQILSRADGQNRVQGASVSLN